MNIPQPANHLDTMLRQTRMHHVQLSTMADFKANIMLTLASLIGTFSIGYLSDPVLRWPVVVLLLFCLATIVSAAYAVMPKLDFNYRPDLKKDPGNILFFGNFMNLNYEEYAQTMEQVMSDSTHAYEAQVREVYELGVYLGYKKYRFVRLAYTTFIAGLLSSALTLLAVEFFNWVQ